MPASPRARRFVAAVVLLGQFAAAVAIAVALSAAVLTAGDDDCGCPIVNGHACAMHHHQSGAKTNCRLSCADRTDVTAIVTLLGPIGIIPSPAAFAHRPETMGVVVPDAPLTDRTFIPDSPPPRA